MSAKLHPQKTIPSNGCALERQLQEKEAQLKSRDQTVQELTDRLAQAVERLDRVQRVGTDRITINTAAFPKEVVQQQTELVEDLKRAVEMWENMQLSAGLGQLELQFSDLKALIEEHFRESEPVPEPEPEPLELETAQAESPAALAEESLQNPPDMNPLVPDLDEKAQAEEAFDSAVEEVCPLRPPEILNLTEATVSHLKRCVVQQEKYIEYLTGRLQRTAENQTSVDWEGLSAEPEKLATKLERTATKLQQSRHFAEYEVALQFTRLRRKERELKLVSDELAGQMQSLGHIREAEQGKDSTGSRRWMRMLGMGKPESE